MNLRLVGLDATVAAQWQGLARSLGWAIEASEQRLRRRRSASVRRTITVLEWGGRSLGEPASRWAARVKTEALGGPLILTALRPPEDATLIELFESGIDDFFPHDLPPRLVAAKLKAHARRLPASRVAALTSPRGDIKLELEKRQMQVRGPDGTWSRRNDLTATEFALLAFLLERPETAVPRPELLDRVGRDLGEAVLPSAIDKHIERLRRKLGAAGRRIQTVYGVGYVYREE